MVGAEEDVGALMWEQAGTRSADPQKGQSAGNPSPYGPTDLDILSTLNMQDILISYRSVFTLITFIVEAKKSKFSENRIYVGITKLSG